MPTSESLALSPYERLGGAPTIAEAVERFYTRLLADPQVSGYFTHIELPTLKRHQAALLSQVLGGPKAYDGRELKDAHRGMGINRADYDKVCEHLLAVLSEMGAPQDIADSVSGVLKSVADDVVERDS
ncbi:hemoglobin [Stackebrandtia albiflava]|uniref:Group 1 truncated hemoglobin n=1 Tax=Stackebrandtia albiflava TaxID=406432 RepID=A0A562V1W8_9ACTN|nr:group 1 truncated hemoglobin [Stackebrandtia albiflava]TWJ11910.1 hemoglobin [Stackebrandtia albiflava]